MSSLQSFAALPRSVLAGDFVCLLQDTTSEAAQYQVPAKLTDALAMGTPVLASHVPPLADLGRRGVLTYVDQGALTTGLQTLLADPSTLHAQAAAGRDLFLSDYSYAATLPRLEAVVDRALAVDPGAPQSWVELLAVAREQASVLAADEGRAAPIRRLIALAPSEGSGHATILAGRRLSTSCIASGTH